MSQQLVNLLLAPHMTEKSMRHSEGHAQYVFQVLKQANKDEVKKAVELMFNTKVDRVRIVNVKGKAKRFGQIEGRTKGWKKAYVTLKEGQQIDFSGFQA